MASPDLPDLEVLADPSFAWPDLDLPMHGWTRPQTSRADLVAMNRTAYAFTGAVNMVTGALAVDATRIEIAIAPARA